MLRQLAVARNKFVNAIVMFSRSTELFWLFRLILGLLVTISILEICLTLLTGHGLIILRDQAPASRLRSAYSGRPLHPDGSADFSKVAESVLHGRHSSKDDSFFRGEFRHFTRRASGDRDGQHPGVFCGEHDQDCLGWLNRWSNWRLLVEVEDIQKKMELNTHDDSKLEELEGHLQKARVVYQKQRYDRALEILEMEYKQGLEEVDFERQQDGLIRQIAQEMLRLADEAQKPAPGVDSFKK